MLNGCKQFVGWGIHRFPDLFDIQVVINAQFALSRSLTLSLLDFLIVGSCNSLTEAARLWLGNLRGRLFIVIFRANDRDVRMIHSLPCR